MKKVSAGRVIVPVFAAICAYLFFEYALLVCTPSVPQVCKPQFSFISNIFFGVIIGILTYLVYGLLERKKI
jgi:hypothetical protein